jgi:transcriptional regulator with XRE-family HTH domain
VGRPEKPVNANDTSPGARLRLARQAADMSVSALAPKVHYSAGYLSGVENGQLEPSAKLIMRYEEALNLPRGTLLLGPIESKEEWMCDVFLSGPPSVVADLSVHKARELAAGVYERIGRICDSLKLRLYTPPVLLNPKEGPQLYASFTADKRHIDECKLLIAYTGTSSMLAGMHLYAAVDLGKPIVLLAKAGRTREMETFTMPGADVRARITFADELDEQAEAQLKLLLYDFFSRKNLDKAAATKKHPWTVPEYQAMEQLLATRLKALNKDGATILPPVSEEEWENLRATEIASG